MQWEKAQRTVKLLLNVWPTLLNNNHYTPKGNPFMTQHTQYYSTLAMAQYRKLKVYQTVIKLSANFLWLSKKKPNNIWLTRTLINFFWTKSTKSISKSPTRSESLVCREERQRREFTARQHWPGDPEADLRTKICGLSVHMVTGVCRISNPIQPASLFSFTISVKKKGAVHSHSHSHGAKLKTDSQLASMLDILKCQMYACNTCTLVDSYHLQLSEHRIRWKPVNKSVIISKLTSHNSVFISLS